MFPDYVWENALEMLIGRMEQKRTQAVTVMVPTRMRIGDTA
jgi:LacI family transcriptional regulator